MEALNRKKKLYCGGLVTYILLSSIPLYLLSSCLPRVLSLLQAEQNPTIENVLDPMVMREFTGRWRTNQSETGICYYKTKYQSKYLVEHVLEIKIIKGEHLDDGMIFLSIFPNTSQWTITHHQSQDSLASVDTLNTTYQQTNMIRIQEVGKTLTKVKVQFQDQNYFQLHLEYDSTTYHLHLEEEGIVQKSKTISLGILLLLIHGLNFYGTMSDFQLFLMNRQAFTEYSFVLLLFNFAWDGVLSVFALRLCIFSHISAFFLLTPIYLFSWICLTFQFVILIFKVKEEYGFAILKNLLVLLALVLIYPLLILTNLNGYFLLMLPMFVFCQLYTYAVKEIRPQILAPFHCYVYSRHLLIFYIRCNPYNYFDLDQNYPLGLVYLLIILFQLLLMNVQRQFGPRAIFPECILPPIIERISFGGLRTKLLYSECAICLNSFDDESWVLRTPCTHYYHEQCLRDWLRVKNSCPECRAKLFLSKN